MKRGDAAWALVKTANMFNEPAPEGKQYVVASVQVKYTGSDTKEQHASSGDWNLTGNRYVRYSSGGAVPPKPALDAKLFSGGQAEGNVVFLAGRGENSLILTYRPLLTFDDKGIAYFAGEEGASLTIPKELSDIKPSDQGKQRTAPIPIKQPLVVAGWQITVLEALRGDEAWKLLKAANQFNKPPEAGKEYVLARVRIRNVDPKGGDKVESTSGMFRVTGAKNVVYESPSLVPPEPNPENYLYPGGETEGWVVGQVGQGETGLILMFRPLLSFSESGRFFSLDF